MRFDSISKKQTRQPLHELYLLYHELRLSVSRYSYVTDTAMFARHLDVYRRLDDTNGLRLRPKLTFDDGHISNIELAAPMLQSPSLAATFFITVGWTGMRSGYMGWPEVRSLHEAGHTIGAHGWTHKLLTHCSDCELQMELSDARLTLEEKVGASITTMSLPGGRFNDRVLAACHAAGYTQVYSSIPRAESVPAGTMVGRLNILGNMEPEWIAKLFEPNGKLLNDVRKRYRQKEAVKRLLGDRLYAKLWAVVNRQEPGTDDPEGAAG